MSVELVNGHVLFPNRVDWTEQPKWSRRWENEVSDSLTGRESRFALRAQPRVSLTYRVTPATIIATQMLDDRIRAAAKSGKACCPYFGRGAALVVAANAGDNTVQLTDAWPWQAGDYCFAGDEHGSDAKLVTTAVLAAGVWTLTLDDVLDFGHGAGALAWPLLFGKFTPPEFPALTPRIAQIRLGVTELVSSRSAQIGAVVPDAGDGIGHMAIGSTFVVS